LYLFVTLNLLFKVVKVVECYTLHFRNNALLYFVLYRDAIYPLHDIILFRKRDRRHGQIWPLNRLISRDSTVESFMYQLNHYRDNYLAINERLSAERYRATTARLGKKKDREDMEN